MIPTARTRGPLVAALLALAAPAAAHDPDPAAPGSSVRPERSVAGGDAESKDGIDVRARLRSIPGGLSLEVGGTVLELRLADAPGAQGNVAPPGAHELRATLSVDGQERGVVVRVVPPPAQGAPATP